MRFARVFLLSLIALVLLAVDESYAHSVDLGVPSVVSPAVDPAVDLRGFEGSGGDWIGSNLPFLGGSVVVCDARVGFGGCCSYVSELVDFAGSGLVSVRSNVVQVSEFLRQDILSRSITPDRSSAVENDASKSVKSDSTGLSSNAIGRFDSSAGEKPNKVLGSAPGAVNQLGSDILYGAINALSQDIRDLDSRVDNLELKHNNKKEENILYGAVDSLAQDVKDLKSRVESVEDELKRMENNRRLADDNNPATALSVDKRGMISYQRSMDLLHSARYKEAEELLTSIVSTGGKIEVDASGNVVSAVHPVDSAMLEVVSNSWYWLGEISGLEKNYKAALVRFKEARVIYPESPKRELITFKIAHAYKQLNDRSNSCAELKKLLSDREHLNQVIAEDASKLYAVECEGGR